MNIKAYIQEDITKKPLTMRYSNRRYVSALQFNMWLKKWNIGYVDIDAPIHDFLIRLLWSNANTKKYILVYGSIMRNSLKGAIYFISEPAAYDLIRSRLGKKYIDKRFWTEFADIFRCEVKSGLTVFSAETPFSQQSVLVWMESKRDERKAAAIQFFTEQGIKNPSRNFIRMFNTWAEKAPGWNGPIPIRLREPFCVQRGFKYIGISDINELW